MEHQEKQSRLKDAGLDPSLADTHREISGADTKKKLDEAIARYRESSQPKGGRNLPPSPDGKLKPPKPRPNSNSDLVEAARLAIESQDRESLELEKVEDRAVAGYGRVRGEYLAALASLAQSEAYSEVHTSLLDDRLTRTVRAIREVRGQTPAPSQREPRGDWDGELSHALGE